MAHGHTKYCLYIFDGQDQLIWKVVSRGSGWFKYSNGVTFDNALCGVHITSIIICTAQSDISICMLSTAVESQQNLAVSSKPIWTKDNLLPQGTVCV